MQENLEDFTITVIKRGTRPLSEETIREKKRLRERIDRNRNRAMDYNKLMELCSRECNRSVKDLSQLSLGELNRIASKLGIVS